MKYNLPSGRVLIISFVGLFLIAGLVSLMQTSAATYSLAAEAEAGTVTGSLEVGDADGASGDQAVTFGGGNPTVATQLRVAPDGRSFVKADGSPYFWIGDTAWGLFINLKRAEIIEYLDNRAAKGIHVIQAVVVRSPSGSNGPNAEGDMPYSGGNLSSPTVTPGNNPANATEYDYWDHVEFAIQEASKRNMYIALLPAWGYARQVGDLKTTNAEAYGKFLGERYATRYSNLIWVMGGDDNDGFFPEVWRPLAKGVAIGASGSEDYSKVLMTYHPGGATGNSAKALHGEAWLDFNMHQSGHVRISSGPWSDVELSYGKTPVKPFLDGEPTYEEHPINFNTANGYADAFEARASAYAQVFSGAAGHTYGHHNIWMFYGAHRGGGGASPKNIHWRSAMDSAGGRQMGYLRRLVDVHQRRDVYRVRDTAGIIRSDTYGNTNAAIRAIRASDNSYIMVYSMQGRAFDANTSLVSGTGISAYWFNPRDNTRQTISNPQRGSTVRFTPPTNSNNNDWVLVVDDAAKGYAQAGNGS